MTRTIIANDGIGLVESDTSTIKPSAMKSAILHRHIHHEPLPVVGGSGNYLELSNGQKILDATGGAAVSCLGHGNGRVKEAIRRQMDQVSYCHSLFFGTPAAEGLGKELIDATDGQMAKALIVSSGKSFENHLGTLRTDIKKDLRLWKQQ